MQRSFLRLRPAQRACGARAAAPLAGLCRRTLPPSALRGTLAAQASRATQTSRTALASTRAHYATTPTNSSNNAESSSTSTSKSNDVTASAAADANASASPLGGEGDGDAHAVSFSNAPSLRDTLPPSAVDLPETSFLKCIEKEIMDETYRLDKEEGPPQVPVGWTMHHTEGSSFLYGRRVWVPPPSASAATSTSTKTKASSSSGQSPEGGETQQQQPQGETAVPRAVEKHFLRLQLTTRDASLDPECDVRGEHFPFSFFAQRVRVENEDGKVGAEGGNGADIDLNSDAFDEHSFYHDSIEVRCDVVDGELVIDNVVYHNGAATATPATAQGEAAAAAAGATRPSYANPFGGYPGPDLDEAEEEVLDGIQSWLAERGVDDQLGEFMGQYAIWTEQTEYETWLRQLRDYVAA